MLMICKVEIANYRFKFCKLSAYFYFANYKFLEIASRNCLGETHQEMTEINSCFYYGLRL